MVELERNLPVGYLKGIHMKVTYQWVFEGIHVLFVWLEERVYRVNDVGRP